MSARVARGRCACRSGTGVSKTWYRNRRAALAGRDTSRQRSVARGAPAPELWWYRCPTTSGWHLTGNPQWTPAATPPAEDHHEPAA